MSMSKKEIKRILESHFATEEFPLKVKEISLALGLNESNKSCPMARSAIRGAIRDGLPVGSSAKGYFLIRSAKQMQRYLNSLMRRQIALSQRIDDVYHAFYG